MSYSDEFKRLINECKGSPITYIGTGNPSAKILIIGKECAIDMNTESDQKQYMLEITENLNDWCNNIETNLKQTDVECWFDGRKYNPLYPYKGQKAVCNKNKNKGTSATWWYYQKLFNQIIPGNSEDIRVYVDLFSHI